MGYSNINVALLKRVVFTVGIKALFFCKTGSSVNFLFGDFPRLRTKFSFSSESPLPEDFDENELREQI